MSDRHFLLLVRVNRHRQAVRQAVRFFINYLVDMQNNIVYYYVAMESKGSF